MVVLLYGSSEEEITDELAKIVSAGETLSVDVVVRLDVTGYDEVTEESCEEVF